MDRSAIILAGGFSSRFGRDKGLVLLSGRPLVRHVLDRVEGIADEKIVVVSSKVQAESLAKSVGSEVKVCVDRGDVRSPLVGAFSGFDVARGRYSLLLPCDVPLVSSEVLLFLFELCLDKSAAIPRWPNGCIEPLHAVYRTESALDAAWRALSEGELDMRSLVNGLRGVRYVSTLVLEQLDAGLRTFFNVNTPLDLKSAESMLGDLNK